MNEINNWEALLNPELLRKNLVAGALYLCSYEILKNTIVERIKSFFNFDYKNGKSLENQEYRKEVRNINKNIVSASLQWLKKNTVISEDDILKFNILRSQRDEIAHRMIDVLSSQGNYIHINYLTDALELLEKIEKWWIVNFEIPVNPDFDKENIEEHQVMPGSIIILKHLRNIALEYKK